MRRRSNFVPPRRSDQLSRDITKPVDATKQQGDKENTKEEAQNLRSPLSGHIERAVFTVLHNKKSAKKRKSYEDGVLVLEKGKAFLYDMEGKMISKTSFSLKLGETMSSGSTLEFAGRETEVLDRVPVDRFDSGRLFLGSGQPLSCLGLTKEGSSSTVLKPFKSVSLPAKKIADPLVQVTGKPEARPLFDPNRKDSFVIFQGNEETVSTVVDPKLSSKLRLHQKEGVQFMFDCVTGKGSDASCYSTEGSKIPFGRGCILADEMGLGKTLQTITLIWTLIKQGPFGSNNPWCYRCVVVTPSSLVRNWEAEFRKWLGMERIQPIVVTSGGDSAKGLIEDFSKSKVNRVLILSYEMYRKYSKVLNSIHRLDLVVCDEGHRLKSAAGNQTVNALKGCPAKRRVLLTGTPVQNELNEFFAMADFVSPGALGHDARSFQRIFQIPIERGADKSASSEEKDLANSRARELQQLTSSFILRRTSEVNEKFLPSRTDINMFVKLGTDQVARYKSFVKEMFSSGETSGTDALKLIHHLRQVCAHPALADSSGEDIRGLPVEIKAEISGKLFLLDQVFSCIREESEQNKVVVVSNSTKTLTIVESLCKQRSLSFLRLDGSTNSNERQNLVNRFNQPSKSPDGHVFAFLLSAKAGGCGLNLIGANRLVLLDLDWNPATDQQATARIWRDGQTKPVYIYRFIATGTIEERIFQRQQMKLHSANGVVATKRKRQERHEASSGVHVQFGAFSKQELVRLFDLKENTCCDTYDLLRSKSTRWGKDNSDEEDNASTQSQTPPGWDYTGPKSIPDGAVGHAVSTVGESVVSWVHVDLKSQKNDSKQLRVFKQVNLQEPGDESESSEEEPQKKKTTPLVTFTDITSDSEEEAEFLF